MRKTLTATRVEVGPCDGFTRRTYDLFDAYVADFGLDPAEAGEPAVLLASDFLIETLGRGASWERFDVRTFGAFLRERVPPFDELLPGIVAALSGFFCFLCRRGVVSERRASSVVAAIYGTTPMRRRAA